MSDKQPKPKKSQQSKKSDTSRASRFVDFGDDWKKTFKFEPLDDQKSKG